MKPRKKAKPRKRQFTKQVTHVSPPPLESKASIRSFVSDILKEKKRTTAILFYLIFIAFTLLQSFTVSRNAIISILGLNQLFTEPYINALPFQPPVLSYYPKINDNAKPVPPLSATSAILIDVDSQVVLYQKNQDLHVKPASTTKVMTALVALDLYKLSDILTVYSVSKSGESTMGLEAGEKMSFHNLLYGLLLNSGNDAAETLAQNDPQGEAHFISLMNEKAQTLHLVSTHFEDVTGLESPNHYTSALDLARLASIAMQNPTFKDIVKTEKMNVSDTTGNISHPLKNVNQLLGSFEGAIGVKTGFTEEAGQVLVAAASRNGHTLLSAVFKSNDRFFDSSLLLDWGFNNIHYIKVE